MNVVAQLLYLQREMPRGELEGTTNSIWEPEILAAQVFEDFWLMKLIREAASYADPGVPPEPIMAQLSDR